MLIADGHYPSQTCHLSNINQIIFRLKKQQFTNQKSPSLINDIFVKIGNNIEKYGRVYFQYACFF